MEGEDRLWRTTSMSIGVTTRACQRTRERSDGAISSRLPRFRQASMHKLHCRWSVHRKIGHGSATQTLAGVGPRWEKGVSCLQRPRFMAITRAVEDPWGNQTHDRPREPKRNTGYRARRRKLQCGRAQKSRWRHIPGKYVHRQRQSHHSERITYI